MEYLRSAHANEIVPKDATTLTRGHGPCRLASKAKYIRPTFLSTLDVQVYLELAGHFNSHLNEINVLKGWNRASSSRVRP